MAANNDSGSSAKKSSESGNDLPIFSAENLQSNLKVIYYSRTFLSIIGGVVVGILGLTGLMGFVIYFLIMAMTSLGLAAKAKFSINSYFDYWNQIVFEGFLGGLMGVKSCTHFEITSHAMPFPWQKTRDLMLKMGKIAFIGFQRHLGGLFSSLFYSFIMVVQGANSQVQQP